MAKKNMGRGKKGRKLGAKDEPNPDKEPQVGIFWLVAGELIFDVTPLGKAERYGNHLTHSGSHIDVWKRLRQMGKVPQETEYEEYPRGRVNYEVATETSSLLADRCILEGKDLVTQIRKMMHLSKQTTIGTDSHYRCSKCLWGKGVADEEDDGE